MVDFFNSALLNTPPRSDCSEESEAKRSIVPVIRSCAGGTDETRRGLCYDRHHVWMVTVGVALPATRPCVLRGDVGAVDKDSASPEYWRNIQRYWRSRRLCRSIRCSASSLRRANHAVAAGGP